VRPDKVGNFDAASGLPRKTFSERMTSLGIQKEYDLNYDHTLEMLAAGVTSQQLLYSDPDINRSIADYAAFPIIESLFNIIHSDGSVSHWNVQTRNGVRTVYSFKTMPRPASS
jgi:hypothetical protein